MDTLNKRITEIIKDNWRAYCNNFETPIIIKESDGFYVYKNIKDHENGESYIQYCYNVSYLDGWLYGAVQAANKIMNKIHKIPDMGMERDK